MRQNFVSPFQIENSRGDRCEDAYGDAGSRYSVAPQRGKLTLFIALCRFEIHPLKPDFL